MDFLRKFDAALMATIGLTLIVTVILAFASPDYFVSRYAAEDRLVEYGTAIFLLVASIVLGTHALSLWRRGQRGAAALTLLYALIFFVAAGEEVSWGQRIIGWESGEFFIQHNKQEETNLHNLVVGDVHLTTSLFGPVLTVFVLLYLIGLPLVYPKGGSISALADRMALPVPWLRHGIIALIASIIIALLSVGRKWEVYELIFALLMVSIFILPQNRDKTR